MSPGLAEPSAAASAPSPLVSFDLASTIERLGNALPPSLVGPSAIAAVVAFTRPLPPVFHWLMLETRLTPAHGGRVDLLASIIDQRHSGSSEALPPVTGAPLVTSWAGREDPLLADARVLWLEWDAPFTRAPLQIASLDPRFWGSPSAAPDVTRQLAVYDAIHRASFGRPHDERVLERLGRALAALPAAGSALFGASLAARGRACDRLFVALPRGQVLAWLRAVRWPGDEALAGRWLAVAVAAWEPAYLQVELAPEGLTPYLAIESRQTMGNRSERRARATFLDGLVTAGLVPRERAHAALAWGGARRVGAHAEVRSVHLKCAFDTAADVEVKAYLGVHYLPAITDS